MNVKMQVRGRRSRGFTLIELLIVVAIIAILAAIAVPNFLEAQVRAKVSRVNADMRTLATAIEAYAIDWGVYMPCVFDAKDMHWNANNPKVVSDAWRQEVLRIEQLGDSRRTLRAFTLAQLTTPTAYMTSLLDDPFLIGSGQSTGGSADSNPGYYWYERMTHVFGEKNRLEAYTRYGFAWLLMSPGPNRWAQVGALPHVLRGAWKSSGQIGFRGPYDPSNGTVSRGLIFRTSQGIYSTNPDVERFAHKGG